MTVTIKKAHVCGRKCNKRLKTHYYGEQDDGEAKFLATITFEENFQQTPPANSFEPNFEDKTKVRTVQR